MTKTTYNHVLKLVNRILAKHGKKPLKKLSAGEPRNGAHCPISQSLLDGSFATDNTRITTGRDRVEVGYVNELKEEDRKLVSKFTTEVDFVDEVKSIRRYGLTDPITLVKTRKTSKKR